MPKFLFLTTISRHDARLSSTTHCALRASRINYNLTNLSRCNSFLQYFPNMDLCSSLPSSPFPFYFFPMLSSDSPGTLSFSLPKSPSFPVTLQALVAKVTTTISLSLVTLQALSCRSHQTSHTTKMQISHATQLSVLQLSRCHLFSSRLPLLSGTPSPISTTSLIQH